MEKSVHFWIIDFLHPPLYITTTTCVTYNNFAAKKMEQP